MEVGSRGLLSAAAGLEGGGFVSSVGQVCCSERTCSLGPGLSGEWKDRWTAFT